jgi:membrane dipeptidase
MDLWAGDFHMALLTRAMIGSAAVVLAGCAAPSPADPDSRALAIHDRVITIDAHMDIPPDFMAGEKDAGRETKMQIDLPKMDAGRLDGAAFALGVLQNTLTAENYAKARAEMDGKLAAIEKMIAAYPDRIRLARTADDATRAAKSGKHFAMISMVNAYGLGPDISRLQELHARGLRMIAFNHAGNNQFSDSNRPQERYGNKPNENGGLTPLGKQAVAEMNRLGIIVDVSQASSNALRQMVDMSKAPVLASHVGLKKIVDTGRNLTDEEMKLIAVKGGAVCIVAFPSYLKSPSKEQVAELTVITTKYGLQRFADASSKLPPDKLAEFSKEFTAFNEKYPGASVVELAASIDAAVKTIGVDHVCIATDMEHGGGVTGYKTAAEAAGLTKELVKLGYAERDIAKLWGGNVLRVWKAVEKAAG